MTNLSLWDLAAQKAKEGPKKIGLEEDALEEEKAREDSYLLMFGNKDCGKTSLLLRFLDREEQAKPTIALEYTFARRSKGADKEVGHLWELGGGPFLTNLLDIPLSVDHVKDLSLLLMLDLSKPEELWHTAEALLAASKTRLEKLMQELRYNQPHVYEALISAAKIRVPPEHQDRELLKPFPVPLAIVGTKYDVFQDLDSEKRKLICKTLRFLAHTNGATLAFYSNKMEGLVTRGRALLSQLVFGTAGSRGLSVDPGKPLFVPAGADSFADIGAPGGSVSASNPFELWKAAFTEQFPQKNTTMEVRDDPAKDPQYKEPAIDNLRAAKDQELERFVVAKAREAEQERKLAIPIPRPAPAPAKVARPAPDTPSPEPPTPEPPKQAPKQPPQPPPPERRVSPPASATPRRSPSPQPNFAASPRNPSRSPTPSPRRSPAGSPRLAAEPEANPASPMASPRRLSPSNNGNGNGNSLQPSPRQSPGQASPRPGASPAGTPRLSPQASPLNSPRPSPRSEQANMLPPASPRDEMDWQNAKENEDDDGFERSLAGSRDDIREDESPARFN